MKAAARRCSPRAGDWFITTLRTGYMVISGIWSIIGYPPQNSWSCGLLLLYIRCQFLLAKTFDHISETQCISKSRSLQTFKKRISGGEILMEGLCVSVRQAQALACSAVLIPSGAPSPPLWTIVLRSGVRCAKSDISLPLSEAINRCE